MAKRTISSRLGWMLAAAALSAAALAAVPCASWAAELESIEFDGEATVSQADLLDATGKCGDNVSYRFLADRGVLSIHGSGDMYDYTSADQQPWAAYRNEIKSISITSGVTSIGSYAFYGCESLQHVTVFTSGKITGAEVATTDVKTVGDAAFGQCTSLTTAWFGEGVTTLGVNSSPFAGCTALTNVVVPSTVTKIAAGGFDGCTALMTINYGGTKTTLDGIQGYSLSKFRICYGVLKKAESTVRFVFFSDMQSTDKWYYTSVMQAVGKGLIEGYDDGSLGPKNTLTRAQAAAILWRYYEPAAAADYDAATAKDSTGMDDLTDGQWYTGAANWAVSKGVINGFGHADGSKSFNPDGTITREQLCAIIANASASLGSGGKEADLSKLSSMPDASKVDSWATQSVAWALTNGVISGKGSGGQRVVDPLGSVTRAEMAAITMNSIGGSLL